MAELPSGTVTFLFTDIEGSTARWEGHPEAMRVALARHDALIRAAIVEHHGHVVKSTGDGFHAAFSRAPDAATAALEAQRQLQAEPWGEIGALRVRMALHTGVAEERDGDYFGPPLNRAARLLSAGHGGQILLSEVVASLVREALPDGVSLRDLGRHRLKDLAEPERVFQVVAPDLPSDFPPLVSLDARPHNLPTNPTALLGRERELADVRKLFEDGARLVTLTGPGGTGKTRLGLQVAADLLDGFEHGVFLVELAPITEPSLVASTVAQALGVRDVGSRPILDAVKEYLRARSLLLLLDNFEQILPAASVMADLLATCPGLAVLVTSREPLRLRGEREYAVPPLALPDAPHKAAPETLAQYAAVALFLERAVAIRADFAVTAENAPAVVEVCARLDGLPLAIELAAARVRMLTPAAMVGRLERRLPLLTGGARDLPARQRTLRDAIAWSYNLLTEAEQRLFRRLGVFVGGFSLEAAEAVCGDGEPEADVLDGIGSLVEKSLVRPIETPSSDPRFGLLETIREYASERLTVSGEAALVRSRQAYHFLAWAEQAEPRLLRPEQAEWLARIEVDHDNLRAALAWSLSDEGEPDLGLRLAGALYRFWWRRRHMSEGREWLRRLLAREPAMPTEARARAHLGAGSLARAQGDYASADSDFGESLGIYRQLDDRPRTALAAFDLATVLRWEGDYGRARVLTEESLSLSRELNDPRGISDALVLLGELARDDGHYDHATRLFEEALGLARERGDIWQIASRLIYLGNLAVRQGQYDRAATLLEKALAMKRAVADEADIPHILNLLSWAARGQCDLERARRLGSEGLRGSQALGVVWGTAACLEQLARLDALEERPERAARLFAAADALQQSMRLRRPPSERPDHESAVTAVRSSLGQATFATAWAQGRAMTLEQAVAYALDEQLPA